MQIYQWERFPGATGAGRIVMFTFMLVAASLAWAEDVPDSVDHSEHMMDSGQIDHSGHSMDTEPVDHSGHDMNHEAMDHDTMDHSEMDHSEHEGHGAAAATVQQDAGDATDDLRDPHAYAEGEDFGPMGQIRLADQHNFGAILIHRLEAVRTDDNSWTAFEGQGWYGRTYNRANLKLEGEFDGGEVHELRTELLWSRAIAPFWDSQLGIRYDSGEEPDRTWGAIGVQGLAPYWFHVDATFYVGDRGDTTLRFASEYDLLFTQKLILQPKLEANLYGQNDEVRGTGSGLSDLSLGLRLRYEFTRQFAPYIGVEWAGLYGGTADFAREDNHPTEETRWVAGLHLWF